MKGLITVLAVAALMVTGGAAMGITYSDSIPLSTTNYVSPPDLDPINIPQFDQSGGDTLTSVKLTLEGQLHWESAFESLDASPATVTMTRTGSLDLQGPGGSLLTLTPVPIVTVDAVSTFDTVIDFGGTSGRTLADEDYSGMTMVTYTNAADLAMFIGAGEVDFTVDAMGGSAGTGAGNLITQVATSAGVTVTVEYSSRPPDQGIPEPATAMSSVLAAAALGLVLRRRRNRA